MATGDAEHPNPGEVTTSRGLGKHVRDSIVVIKIGPDSVPYYVHKSLLSDQSAYFDRAFKGKWREAEESIAMLENVDCFTFDIFVHWLYTQRLPEKRSDWVETLPSERYQRTKAFQMSMIRVRAFADRFMVPGLSQIMECILSQYLAVQYVYYEVVAYAYDHLPVGSMILKAMIHSHCHFSHRVLWATTVDEKQNFSKLPREFLLGAMTRYMEVKHGDAVNELKLSNFHEHSCERDTVACKLVWESLINDIN